ncbi:MAG TPA: hypothetical protein VK153_02395 [Candidatus Paceibacterota bacterium]|nr:hypothetical protein [Candidatus Paceibacterota bacterium]
MKNLSYLKYISILIGIVFIFINWKIGVCIFSITYFFFYVFIHGPNYTLNFLGGLSIVSALIFIFINWKVSILLILISFFIIKFRLWGNKINVMKLKQYEKENNLK